MTFTRVGNASEIPANQGKCFTVAGKKIAVFHKDGRFFALDDACTHMEASLAEGEIEGDHVVCPWHAAIFHLETGATPGPPANGGVKSYPCRRQGDAIEIDV